MLHDIGKIGVSDSIINKMIQKISPEEVKSIIDSVMPHYLIDVREQGEYNESHINGAKLVPLSRLESFI